MTFRRLNGYWAFGSRLMTMGWPAGTDESAKGLSPCARPPSPPCGPARLRDLYAAMLTRRSRQASPRHRRPLGQASASPRRRPVDRAGDATVLKGMVLVLNPHVQGPGGTILYSRDGAVSSTAARSSAGTRTGASRVAPTLLQRRRLIWARLRVSGAAPQGSRSRA
ncbi:MAG: hypothetical protein ACLR7Z_01685 [Bilophila wadsworthia]